MKRFIPLRRLSVLLAFMLCITMQAGAQTFEDWTSTNHSNSSSSTHTWTLDLKAGEILEFDWGVSSESGCDWLTITINGSQVVRQAGEQRGTYTYNVTTTGTVTIRATYSKDGSVNNGSDTGWVTNLGRLITSDNGITYHCMIDGTARLSSGTSFEGDLEIPESISVDGVDYTVTSVAASAFQNNANLSSVVIPATVTSVGNNAFAECSSLTDVICEDGTDNLQFGTGVFNNTPFQSLYMGRPFTTTATASSTNAPFYQKTSLAMLGFGEGVTSIPSYAFYGCSSLTSVTIPNSVTSIGERAFYNCSGLFYISISNSVTSIGNRAFEGCSGLISVTIPNSVTSIGERTFYNCSGLISVTIPNSVTSIGDSAFEGCSGLTSINIPDGVTSIGYSAFRGCSGLTSITIPDGVTSIGGSAFYNCSGLTSVTIPNSVTSIESSAFYDCSRLTSVNITDLASWCNIDFGNYLANPTNYAQKLVLNGTEIKDIVIPEGITEIKRNAFYNCRGLKSITIPNTVTSIGNHAFYNCRGWGSVTIPNSVTSIGESAFYNGDHITDISVLATTPPTCGPSLMFGGAIHVYEGFADVYKAASGWNSYSIVDDIPVTRVTGLTLDATRYQCGIGKRFTPQVVTYKPEDATIKEVTWSSSDPSTLTIVANTGECIGLKDGIVTITATAKDAGHATATATVYVGNVNPEDAVTISASSENSEYGTVSGSGTFLPGTTVTLTATPKLGYVFEHWSDGSTENPYILEANEDKELVAYFRSTWITITASSANEAMGTVSGDGTFLPGATVTLTATPAGGFEFRSWSDGSTENPYTFEANEDKALVATFGVSVIPEILSKTKATTLKPNQWYVITQARGGESPAYEQVSTSRVMRAATNEDVHVGDSFDDVKNFLVRFLPTEYEGIYKIQWGTDHYWFTTNSTSWGVAGITIETVADEADAGNFFVYNINGQEGHFGMNLTTNNSTYGLIVDNNAAGGTVSFWSTGMVTRINGNNDWTFYEVEVSETFEVEIKATCETEQGSISGSGIYEKGSEVTLTAVPAEGYKFIRWSDGTTDNPYTLLATKNKTLTAEFKLIQMALTDGTVYTNSAEVTYDYVSYTRTFNNTEWQALYVPFQMNYEDWCDEFEVAKVNMFHQYDRDDDGTPDDMEMEIFKVKSGTLKQNHPYLIRAKEVGEKTITLENTTLYPAEENDLTCSSVETLYTFTGTYEGMGGGDMYNNHYYSMGGGSLIQALDVTASLKPFRWYLRMTDREGQVIPTPQSVRIKVFGEDDWTEGIADVHSDNVEHQCYDLQGRKISAAARGLYIVNGKKVMR